MFEETLCIMNKNTQAGPAGPVVTWSKGSEIKAKMQISNMIDVQVAQAQGVLPTGYLVVGKEYEPYITTDTYLEWPKGNTYLRVTDSGVVEAGEGAFKERQHAVEAVMLLPR